MRDMCYKVTIYIFYYISGSILVSDSLTPKSGLTHKYKTVRFILRDNWLFHFFEENEFVNVKSFAMQLIPRDNI